MLQVLLIVLVGVVLAHDALPGRGAAGGFWIAWGLGAGAPMALWLAAHLGIVWCGRVMDRSGSWRAVALAERILTAMRLGVGVAFALAVLEYGWLERVRQFLGGNLVLVDEAMALAPPVVALALGWWSYEPIERRLRWASMLRQLEGAGRVEGSPSRWAYVFEQVRHQLLIVLVPLALIAAWAESMDRVTRAMDDRWAWLEGELGSAIVGVVHIAGVLGVMALMPLALRVLWRTTPLGTGPLRDRLMGLCRKQGVRCRDLLVWHTHSGMLNGAVIGIVPWLRYILLTDALLDSLESEQAEAVMAHEVAHARRHHLPWLIVALVGSGTLGWAAASLAISEMGPLERGGAMMGALLPLAVAAGFGALLLGFISRRFEEQADAFAVQHMSGWSAGRRTGEAPTVGTEAAEAMAGALGMVASLNHIPTEKFTFRHGSIAGRQRKIRALVGQSADRLPIDRTARGLKAMAVVVLIAGIALAFYESLRAATGQA